MLGALGVSQGATPLAARPQAGISTQDVKGLLAIQGRDLDEATTELVRRSLQQNLAQFKAVRDLEIDDAVAPALMFCSPRR